MSKSDRLTNLGAFVEYATALDPSWPQRTQGASEDQRAALRRYVGAPLPGLYDAFLARLGENTGGVRFCGDTSTRAVDVLGYYAEASAQEPSWIPADSIVIGVGGVALQEVSLHPASVPIPPVVLSDGDTINQTYAESFAHLLYRMAFREFSVRRARMRAGYASRELKPRNDALSQAVEEMGFERQWFADDISYNAVFQNLKVSSFQVAEQPFAMMVAGPDEASVLSVGDRIAARLGIERVNFTRNGQ
jgi:hypothetical protein